MSTRRSLRSSLVVLGAVVLHRTGGVRLLQRAANRSAPTAGRRAPAVRGRRSRHVQILAYHRVAVAGDDFLPHTPRTTFERQMEHLASDYHVCSLGEAVERLERDDVPDNALVLTFDDGYRDNYLHAFPVLRRFGLTATTFLATDAIGSGRILWHDRVFRAFAVTREAWLRDYGADHAHYPLASAADRAAARSRVLQFLRRLAPAERVTWLDRLVHELRVDEPATVPELMLSWEQVREMQRAGLAFGSHTVTHPILSTLSAEQARHELVESKREIERQLQCPVTAFAYPNGSRADFDESSKRLLREVGYTCAVTTLPGTNRPPAEGVPCDLLELRRDGARDEGAALFAARLTWSRLCS